MPAATVVCRCGHDIGWHRASLHASGCAASVLRWFAGDVYGDGSQRYTDAEPCPCRVLRPVAHLFRLEDAEVEEGAGAPVVLLLG